MFISITELLVAVVLVEIFLTCLVLGTLIIFLSKDTTQIPELLSRIMNIEGLVEGLSNDVSTEIGSSVSEIWKTHDGKYTANSFEELLSKMSNDPDGPLTEEELETLQSIFKKITGNDDDE